MRSAEAPATEPTHLHRLRVFARFGFVVAKADGRIAMAERVAIRAFLADLFGHDPIVVRHIDPTIEQVEGVIPSEEWAVREVLAVVTNPVDRQAVYAAAERIADASGEKNQRKMEMLARLRSALGISLSPGGERRGEAPLLQPATPKSYLFTTDPSPQAERGAVPDPRTVLEIEPGVELSPSRSRRRTLLALGTLYPRRHERAVHPIRGLAWNPELTSWLAFRVIQYN